MRRVWLAMVLTACVATGVPARPAAAQQAPSARVGAILAALGAIESKPLWPGFDLARVPVAVFDGHHTYLFRHPAPPADFAAVPGRGDLRMAEGQHPAVRANSSAEIGGVLTATCLADRPLPPEVLASIVAHEAFHVFQRQAHPKWVTNEMNLFTYPSGDAPNLAAARVEADALERALAAPAAAGAACWTRAALDVRAKRFERLPKDAVDYERGVELVEGTASLVQYRTGDRSQPAISASGFAADATRLRAYAAGRTIGLLLDRFAPGWENRVEAAGAPVLDEDLRRALPAVTGGGCAVPLEEQHAHEAEARRDVDALLARRDAAYREFTGAAGWRLLVRAPAGGAFGPQGFDPMNLVRLPGTDVLHTRWLKAGRDGGAVEVMNRRALTRAAGSHPLFSGFREVEVTGLATEPAVIEAEGRVTVRAEGVQADFPRATLTRDGRTITIDVGK